jgi:quercetin dioxygenase-like cupin family protein/alkylhydroperoxidase/carboxymuconolactone decarboxylase family protein YurZ
MWKPVKFLILTVFIMVQIRSIAQAQNATELSPRQKHIIPVAAFTAIGDIEKLKPAFHEALDAGLTINEIKEILTQMYAYAGFPRSLNGINAFISVLEDRAAKSIDDPAGKEASPLPADFDVNAYGNKVRNELTGQDLTNNPSAYAQFAPVIDEFLKEHLFGDIFARDVLDYKDRELATISALAAMDGTEPQLKAHLNVSLNTGLTPEQLTDFAAVLEGQVSAESGTKARAALDQISPGTQHDEKALAPQEKSMKVIKHDAQEATQGSAEYFTGKVMIDSNFASEEENSYIGAMVNFEAGARTAWHTHLLGQTLVVISGRGLVQKQGEKAQEILPGDVVWIPAEVKHWHGAAPDSAMAHIAIVEAKDGSATTWMEHVTDEEYLAE